MKAVTVMNQTLEGTVLQTQQTILETQVNIFETQVNVCETTQLSKQKTKAKFENRAEIPAITCNSGQQ